MITPALSRLLTLEDVLIAARTAYGEGRGEGYEEMLRIACVLVNRWTRTDGQFARDDTLATACLRHVQFSAWNASDPNLAQMVAADMRSSTFRRAIVAVLAAIDGQADPTNGATHYHTRAKPAYADIWPPRWTASRKPCAESPAHLFYNDIP